MAGRDDIRFGQILRQLLTERFRNKRKEFAHSIHVSESALSQYVRGKATPSLAVLVSIARELDVSLDYLVFGTEPETPAPDYGGLVAHVEEAIARTQVKTATLRDFVGRVGSALAEDIESTARRLLLENDRALGGGLTATEVLELESISKHIRIATVDLDLDVLLLADGSGDRDKDGDPAADPDVAAAPFTSVISRNVRRGSEYSYVIPEGPEWRRKARQLRDAVGAYDGMANSAVDRRLKFYESGRALSPSYVLYTLDTALIDTRSERLLDQIGDFVNESSGLVALAEPTSRRTQYYMLIDPKHHQRIVADHDAMLRSCPRLVFD
ncbi:MAG TPA: helix-turn-helix transcriptional regulator [Kribbella sp.]